MLIGDSPICVCEQGLGLAPVDQAARMPDLCAPVDTERWRRYEQQSLPSEAEREEPVELLRAAHALDLEVGDLQAAYSAYRATDDLQAPDFAMYLRGQYKQKRDAGVVVTAIGVAVVGAGLATGIALNDPCPEPPADPESGQDGAFCLNPGPAVGALIALLGGLPMLITGGVLWVSGDADLDRLDGLRRWERERVGADRPSLQAVGPLVGRQGELQGVSLSFRF